MCMKMTHINTTEVSLFDTGVSQEGIDESHIHSDALKSLYCARSSESDKLVGMFVKTRLL